MKLLQSLGILCWAQNLDVSGCQVSLRFQCWGYMDTSSAQHSNSQIMDKFTSSMVSRFNPWHYRGRGAAYVRKCSFQFPDVSSLHHNQHNLPEVPLFYTPNTSEGRTTVHILKLNKLFSCCCFFSQDHIVAASSNTTLLKGVKCLWCCESLPLFKICLVVRPSRN